MKQVALIFTSLILLQHHVASSSVPPKVPPLKLEQLKNSTGSQVTRYKFSRRQQSIRQVQLTKDAVKKLENVRDQLVLRMLWYEREKSYQQILYQEMSDRLAMYTQAHKDSCVQLVIKEHQSHAVDQTIQQLRRLLTYYKNKCGVSSRASGEFVEP